MRSYCLWRLHYSIRPSDSSLYDYSLGNHHGFRSVLVYKRNGKSSWKIVDIIASPITVPYEHSISFAGAVMDENTMVI